MGRLGRRGRRAPSRSVLQDDVRQALAEMEPEAGERGSADAGPGS
jgi:hypothetical protein